MCVPSARVSSIARCDSIGRMREPRERAKGYIVTIVGMKSTEFVEGIDDSEGREDERYVERRR